MSSLITRDFEHIVRTCKLESWKEALAMALTYARADEFANLCGESCLNVAHICINSTQAYDAKHLINQFNHLRGKVSVNF